MPTIQPVAPAKQPKALSLQDWKDLSRELADQLSIFVPAYWEKTDPRTLYYTTSQKLIAKVRESN